MTAKLHRERIVVDAPDEVPVDRIRCLLHEQKDGTWKAAVYWETLGPKEPLETGFGTTTMQSAHTVHTETEAFPTHRRALNWCDRQAVRTDIGRRT